MSISNDRSITENELQNIIGAREEEIIQNVWHQIENVSDKLLSGIITTGGAAQLKDMPEAIKHYTQFQKVKMAKSLITTVDVSDGVTTPQGISIDTLIALLMHGDLNCVSESESKEETNESPTEQPAQSVEPEVKPAVQPVTKEEQPKGGSRWKRWTQALGKIFEEESED